MGKPLTVVSPQDRSGPVWGDRDPKFRVHLDPERVDQLRKRRMWTVEGLAARAGISRAALSTAMRRGHRAGGHPAWTTVELASYIAVALGVELEEIIDTNDVGPS